MALGTAVSVFLSTIEICKKTTGWIAMKFCLDIHGPKSMNPTDFDDPPTVSLAAPGGCDICGFLTFE